MLSSIRQNRSLILSLLLFVLLGAIFFPSAGRDDEYIAFWSVNSLLEFGELVNHNGERVEQGSSLGHILLLTVVSGISRLPVPDIAVPISVVSGIILLFLLNRFKLFINERVVNYALFLTAISFPFIYWSFSGLETSIYTLTLTFYCFFLLKITQKHVGAREYSYLFLVILALQLLRPEAFFVLGLSIGLLWLLKIASELYKKGKKTTTLVRTVIQLKTTRFFSGVILINFAVFAILASFRYFYFDSIFPQPVISKISGIFPGLHSGIRIVPGSRYIIEFFIQNFILVASIIAIINIVVRALSKDSRGEKSSADILVAVALSQFTFILSAGPDWMEAFRFIVPVVPILSLLAAIFYHNYFRKNRNIEKPFFAILICIQAAGFGFFITHDSSSIPLWATQNNIVQAIPDAQNYSWFSRVNTHHIRDIPVVKALKDTIRKLKPIVDNRPIIITSYQAGFVLYHVAIEHYGAIHFIDLAGLVDDRITKCPSFRKETQRLRDEAAHRDQLGHLEVLRYLIVESDRAGTCFSPRPDIIYLMDEISESAPDFGELGYELAFNNTGNISLDFGNSNFYGGYLIDRDLFAKAGLKFEQSHISVEY